MEDLKGRAVRGGFAKLCGQLADFVLRMLSMVVLARLLTPEDFGLIAMVTVVTGVYQLFSTAGLSSAAVQSGTITDEQISTLFWINLAVGTVLALACLATAPVLVFFYQEPRLFWLTVVMAAGFMISAAAVQHSAILQRQLRYLALTAIELASLVVGIAVGVGMALGGLKYWALAGMTIASAVVYTILAWVAAAWIPSMPRWASGVGSMLRFGGTLTVNGAVVYFAYNFDKVLLGRFWGADVLGTYERAFRLINVPTSNLHSAVGVVAFSALSRLQDDPIRLKNYFLKGYSLVMSLTFPVTIFCAVFAGDIILVIFGPQWKDAVIIFRLLTPTILIFGIINPIAWLLYSIGLQMRSLKIALVIAPLAITAYLLGLPYGGAGVAFAFSTAMTLWLVPHVVWCLHGTTISPWDLAVTAGRPFLAGVAAGALAFGVQFYLDGWTSPLSRLAAGGCVMTIAYFAVLLFVMGQKEFYWDLLRSFKGAASEV